MGEAERVTVRPRAWVYLMLVAAMAFGAALAWFGPDPLAAIDAGMRPSKLLAILKWGGALIVLITIWRLLTIKRVSAGAGGIVIASLVSRRRFDWIALRDAMLDRALGSPPAYRLRFGAYSLALLRREYAAGDIAALREMVRAHRPSAVEGA